MRAWGVSGRLAWANDFLEGWTGLSWRDLEVGGYKMKVRGFGSEKAVEGTEGVIG